MSEDLMPLPEAAQLAVSEVRSQWGDVPLTWRCDSSLFRELLMLMERDNPLRAGAVTIRHVDAIAFTVSSSWLLCQVPMVKVDGEMIVEGNKHFALLTTKDFTTDPRNYAIHYLSEHT